MHCQKNKKKLIDAIIGVVGPDEKESVLLSWTMLKLDPKKPTRDNVKSFIQYVNKMRALRQQLNANLDFITPARIEQLRDEAMAADIDDMKAMRPIKCYALVTLFIYMKTASAIDDLIQIFISWIKQIEAQAKRKLEDYRLKEAAHTDEFVLILYNMLLALKNSTTAKAKVHAIEKELDGKTDALIERCREHLGLTGENHMTWMLKPYTNKRHVIFQLLENLQIFSSSNDKSIETAWAEESSLFC